MSGLQSLSKDEISRLNSAMKDETFRNLLADYARAISDPAIRKANEEALRQAESQAGLTSKKTTNNQAAKTKSTVQISESDVD